MKTLRIEFATAKAAVHFARWLCESGEQQYWQWMEVREEDEDGDITATEFNYHGANGRSEFMADNKIRTTLGRVTHPGRKRVKK